MTTDFRALCAELLDWAEATAAHYIQLPAVMLRARAALADEPAVPEGREPASVAGQPSDGEMVRCLADSLRAFKLTQDLADYPADHWSRRAADLLERLTAQVGWEARDEMLLQPWPPIPVSERPWEREEWCDTDGNCWLGSNALDGFTPTWLYGSPAWAERFPNVHRVLLPAHALPLPEVVP